ncbi:hypothetical protein [Evansella cellulosilytica]|uniref:Uncharacterized protein n=1 Tax=Evansella cellulosilytica (strain ATCC 21833 / DSM 2522 / FERM P-1141 / JCM 9156 / N-4) TaxID=649639 RepID=E6TR11_EVAC2|nr:hypothetical protein [Evansella cellulosilytica]ADU29387.1 hypothetical protein Bcell_1117 [Evansella cellulosilytica DSM 2522]
MNMQRPKFIDSEYFYWNEDGKTIRERMKLLPNAPAVIEKEYEDYVSEYEEWERQWSEGLNGRIEN